MNETWKLIKNYLKNRKRWKIKRQTKVNQDRKIKIYCQ